MKAAFHIFICLMLMMLASLVPGSICASIPVSLLALAFGIGRKSAQTDVQEPEATGPPNELPWLMLCYVASLFLGSVVNLCFLVFVGRTS